MRYLLCWAGVSTANYLVVLWGWGGSFYDATRLSYYQGVALVALATAEAIGLWRKNREPWRRDDLRLRK